MLRRVPALAGILFDAGDVLYDATGWRRWLVLELDRNGVSVTYDELVRRWEQLLLDVYCGRAEYWARFARLLASLGVPAPRADAVTAAAREQAVAVVHRRRLFAGVDETLAALGCRGMRLGVLTDSESPATRVRASLDALGIGRHFVTVVSSRDIGHAKPDRAAFDAAVAALDVVAEGCAFVGHDADELDGARRAGLYSIAFNAAPDVVADARVNAFPELAKLGLPTMKPVA